MINDFPQALTIAGSDSDGSAGMQADLHTFFANHVYGTSVITACVAGNSYGIHAYQNMPVNFINQEFKDLADDYHIKAAKTGMLADTTLINTVYNNYQKYDWGPLVVDPVIITKHGNMLLKPTAFNTLKQKLIPIATVLTPNFYEAQKLAKMDIQNNQDMKNAANQLRNMGAKNVIIKGKHDNKQQTSVRDFVLLANGESFWLPGKFFDTTHKNGTGDTLSAAITAGLAKGKSIKTSIIEARKYVNAAIENQINVGHRFGPINHYVKFN